MHNYLTVTGEFMEGDDVLFAAFACLRFSIQCIDRLYRMLCGSFHSSGRRLFSKVCSSWLVWSTKYSSSLTDRGREKSGG